MLALTYSARQFPFFKMCVDGLKLYEVPYFVCQWLLEFDNPPPPKKHITNLFGSSNSELSFHPHYAISLHFNIFQREFCVDGSPP